MTAVTCSSVTPTAMTLTWSAVSSTLNGGDAITFYAVEYSVSNSAYVQLNTDYSSLYTTYTYSNGASNFPANTVYSYKVRAKNGVDYSSIYSTVVTCLTPTNP
jgi:Fibronectin type III domain